MFILRYHLIMIIDCETERKKRQKKPYLLVNASDTDNNLQKDKYQDCTYPGYKPFLSASAENWLI